MTGAKVLVVDDDERTRRMMEAMILPAGYQVILAVDGLDGITKAEMTQPDVILLDVMMPVMDGFETAARLHMNPKTQNIPVVMVTALGEVKDRVKALESGADDFLTKPVDKTELLTRISTLVEKSARINARIQPKKRSLVPVISIIVAILAAGGAAAFVMTREPEQVVTVVEKPVTQEVEVVKEVVRTEIEYRNIVNNVVIEKPVDQVEFSSLEALKAWLAEDGKSVFVISGSQEGSLDYDCDDYALELQRRALRDGYLLSTTIIDNGTELHMINLATIGNEIYYIEPQTNEVWFYCYRD